MVTSDFDGDGVLDLALGAIDVPAVTILKGRGDGTFTFATELSAPGPGTTVVAADLNGDLWPDLIVAGKEGTSLFANHGGGFFGEPIFAAIARSSGPVLVKDLDGDGQLDLIIGDASFGLTVLGNASR